MNQEETKIIQKVERGFYVAYSKIDKNYCTHKTRRECYEKGEIRKRLKFCKFDMKLLK